MKWYVIRTACSNLMIYICFIVILSESDDMLSESDDMLSVESNDMLCGI